VRRTLFGPRITVFAKDGRTAEISRKKVRAAKSQTALRGEIQIVVAIAP
jgi:hypothetical protein